MKIVTFYVLDTNTTKNGLTTLEKLACKITIMKWREGKNILIACDNDDQASKIDLALWMYEVDAFIPHNLIEKKEMIICKTSIYICYTPHKIDESRNLLINMVTKNIKFSKFFDNIIEFVPHDKYLKDWARKRYQEYRNIGAKLLTVKINEKK
ncbi:DNA polymerase III subunit chi [Blochmannia endosymbiont of Colobopsis nipponica]|uniref:DNA polymerase III subunit chi n=1 Tax=Blochmannia endosymbiont of Colobopsis nipponica TaxID=2681987 RepID=UPI001781E67A|nr:DNA polymerase III subunit chi [Blochmannia endosymbiont of Colobopsis nipponica]QOI10813.1 DNA polymerase III subunit chi [Blochmannia endosymbiont of Colobopsis nipponica]